MSEGLGSSVTTVALDISRERNRALLVDLLDGYEVVDLADPIPESTDICIVDEHAVRTAREHLVEWRATEHPVYAPVLLLCESAGVDPWTRYADELGESVDAIQPIPASKAALQAQIESLLQTRTYSRELANERRFVDRLFETTPVAMTLLDTDGTILRANERAEDIFNLSRADIAEQEYDAPAWRIYDENDDPIPSEELPFARVIATREPVYGYEHGIEHTDGERIWLSINMAPFRNDAGEIEYLIASIDDITDRKQLERDLRESEALQRATLSNIRDAVFITNGDGEFTYVCPNTQYLFDYTPDEVWELGTVGELLGGDIVEPGTTIEQGQYQNVEHEIVDKDGDTHTVLVTVDPVAIQDGTRLYTVRDITERVEEQRRFQALIEHSSDVITVLDDTGTIQYQSPSIEHVLGYEQDALVGENVFEYVHPDDRGRVSKTVDVRLENGEAAATTVSEDYRFKHADGSWRWLESVATTDALPNGGHVVNSRDITERREYEAQLREQHDRLETVLSNAPVVLFAFDTDGRYTFVAGQGMSKTGVAADELVGKTFRDTMGDQSVAISMMERALDGEEVHGTVRFGGRDFEVWARPAMTDDAPEPGQPAVIGVAMDVTLTRTAEAEARARQDQIAFFNSLLRHEVLNGLAVVLGNAEILDEQLPDDHELAQHVDRVYSRSQDIVDIVRRIRSVLTKLAVADPELSIQDLSAVTQDRVTQVRSDYPDADVSLDAPDDAFVYADDLLGDVVYNIVSNAIQHNDQEVPVIDVDIIVGPGETTLRVADNGPGIPEHVLGLLFSERGDDRTWATAGTFGMYFVSTMVDRYGGSLDVSERDPRGTSFEITLRTAPENGRNPDDESV